MSEPFVGLAPTSKNGVSIFAHSTGVSLFSMLAPIENGVKFPFSTTISHTLTDLGLDRVGFNISKIATSLDRKTVFLGIDEKVEEGFYKSHILAIDISNLSEPKLILHEDYMSGNPLSLIEPDDSTPDGYRLLFGP